MCDCENKCKRAVRLENVAKLEKIINAMTYDIPSHEFNDLKIKALYYIDRLKEL